MKNIDLLFSNNQLIDEKKIRERLKFNPKKGAWEYNIRERIIDGDIILEIIMLINYLEKNHNKNRLLILKFSKIEFADKLVYIVLECICYYMLFIRDQPLEIDLKAKKTIWTEGIVFSPLSDLNNPDEFNKNFLGNINGRHYRKIIPEIPQYHGTDLSKTMQEISAFLLFNGVPEKNSEELAEVLIELVGNSREHAKTDTLIDIDLTESVYKKMEGDEIYYGMNTAIINYSSVGFASLLKQKIENFPGLREPYTYVKQAYLFHKQFFDDRYNEDEFYILSSFQDKISGSIRKKMGGRGLTTLIASLQENADNDICYMLSEKTALAFKKEYTRFNDNDLIGFNKSSNYLTDIPDKDVFDRVNIFFPGTCYNLSFVIRRDW